MQGITGKLSGKMGSAVFRVREGQQVVTQYNPIVKNPNTAGQQSQRAKFKLMSQLAAIMAPGFGTMGVNERPARGKMSPRNAFTKLNFPLVTTTTDSQGVVATIPMEQLQLTSSFRNLPSLDVTEIEGVGLSIDFSTPPAAEVTTVRIAVVGYADGIASIVNIEDAPVASLPVTIAAPAGKYTVLAYGLIPSESAKASIDLDNIHTPDDDDFISAVELNAMVAAGSMAETKTVGANFDFS